MKIFKNERGATLVLVLFAVTLVTLLTMFLMNQLLQTKKQVMYGEKKVDSENIAQMGLDYYKKVVRERLDIKDNDFGVVNGDKKGDWLDKDKFIQDLGSYYSDSLKIKLDDQHSYEICKQEIVETEENQEIIITFVVVGKSANNGKSCVEYVESGSKGDNETTIWEGQINLVNQNSTVK